MTLPIPFRRPALVPAFRATALCAALALTSAAQAQSEPSSPTTETPASAAEVPAEEAKPAEPFAFADFSWVPGNCGAERARRSSCGPFTGELRVDTVYHYSFNHPKDDTIGGSSEVFRSRRVPGHAARHRRRLPLQERPGAG